jgi:hypothetical protein
VRRRTFCIAPVAALGVGPAVASAGSALALAAGDAARASRELQPAVRALSDMLSDPNAAAALGLRCRALGIAPSDPAACLCLAGVGRGCSARAPASFRDRCRQDYAAGRTVIVDGWLLSFAEVGLFALLGSTLRDGGSA